MHDISKYLQKKKMWKIYFSGSWKRYTSRSRNRTRNLSLTLNLSFHLYPLLPHIVIFEFNRTYKRQESVWRGREQGLWRMAKYSQSCFFAGGFKNRKTTTGNNGQSDSKKEWNTYIYKMTFKFTKPNQCTLPSKRKRSQTLFRYSGGSVPTKRLENLDNNNDQQRF